MKKVCTIATLADVASPLTLRGEAVPSQNGNARLLSIKDLIAMNPLSGSTLPLVRVQIPSSRTVISEGDILMPARGYSYPARLVTNAHETILPTGQIHVIKAHESEIEPSYLVWFLNCKATQDKVASMLTGAAIQSLKKSDLIRLEVELPSLKVQRMIGELNDLKLRKETAQRALHELEAKEIDELCSLAVKGNHV